MKRRAYRPIDNISITLIFGIILLFGGISTFAQQSTSIGTTTIKSNAVLYLYSEGKNQGLIVPVVNDKNRVNAPDEGMIVYDEQDHKLYYRSNTGWVEIGAPATNGGSTGGGGSTSGTIILGGDLSGTPNAATIQRIQGKTLSASNPTNGQILKYNAGNQSWELSTDTGTSYAAGTGITINPGNQVSIADNGVTTSQIASNTIIDTDLNKSSIPLSGFGAATTSIDLGNQKITNLATPTGNADATTKAYVDAADATKVSSSILNAGGDLLHHNGSAVGRLPRGSNGQILLSNASGIVWGNLPSSFPNPMTTPGDLIVGGASGVAQRLGGTAGFLKSTGASLPAWSSVNVGTSDITGTLSLANGGTGATTATTARTNLGLGTLATLNSASLTSNVTGTLPLANGGTAASTAAAARTNLGLGTLATLSSANLTTNVTGVLPLTNGGTGAGDAPTARTNLGLGTLATLNTVSTTEITDQTIADIDVATGAAIAGTKISPDFGGQNIVTLGNIGIGTTPTTKLNVLNSAGGITPSINIQQSSAGDASINLTTPVDTYTLGTNGGGSFKISNSTSLGTNDNFEIRPGLASGTGLSKVYMELAGRGQDGVHINSSSTWGTSLHISNGAAGGTGSGYALTVTGSSGPTSQANDFALIRGLGAVMTIGYQSSGSYYASNFPAVDGILGSTPMRMGINLSSSSTPGYNLEVNGSAAKNSGTAWTNTSDIRLKKDVSQFTDGLNVVTKINPIWFRYNGKGGTTVGDNLQAGIIAQEMKEIAPYTIGTFKAKYDESSTQEEEFLNFNFSALNFAMINAIKELDNRVKELEKENSVLKQSIQDSVPRSLNENPTELQLKAELEIQKTRTDQLEAEMKELKKLLYMEAKKSEIKKE